MSGKNSAENPLNDLNQQAMLSQQGGHGGGTHVALNEIFGRKAEEAKAVMGWKADIEDHSGEGGGDHCDFKSWAGGSGESGGGGEYDHHHGNVSIVGGQDVSSTAIGSFSPSSTPSFSSGGGEREV